METRNADWKDIANAQFGKAFVFSLLILMFILIAPPHNYSIRQATRVLDDLIIIDDNELFADWDSSITDPPRPNNIQIIISDEFPEESPAASPSYRPFPRIDTFWEAYDDPPEPIFMPAPIYPLELQRFGIFGTVLLEVDVLADGSVFDVRIKKSLFSGKGGLDEAAIQAVRKWKFVPGKKEGKAIDASVIIPIEFTLDRNGFHSWNH